jgi:2-polyprenyl-3-methyl-5-hydroxy-6-metoxy-1,4-benzoquinol methylase
MQRRAYYDAEPWYQREKTVDWYQQMEKSNEKMKEILVDYVSPKSVILEIACGGGWLAEHVLKAGVKSYSGFDFAESAVKNAKSRLGNFEDAKIWRADALSDTPYKKKYNLILAHQFLHCLKGDDRIKWLKLAASALYPDGVMVLSSLVGIPENLVSSINPATKQNKPGNRYYAEEGEIIAESAAAGFELEEKYHPENNSAIFVLGLKLN